ncbi:alpha/beta hydrolase [Corynebacterium nuruki]|uniref:alpha/beta hydrolase n=1 Tax=Corynebacterium nuruki TaxID=1032851 RepID=UPI002FDF38AF
MPDAPRDPDKQSLRNAFSELAEDAIETDDLFWSREETPGAEHKHRWRHPVPPSIWGLIIGGLAFALSLTPSLIPRTWLYQGFVAGLTAASGHLIGLFLRWNWHLWARDMVEPSWERLTARRKVPMKWRRRIVWAVIAVIVVALLIWILFTVRWQQELAGLMGAESYTAAQFLLVLPVGLAVWAVLDIIGRGIAVFTGMLANAVPGNNTRYGLRLIISWGVVAVVTVVVVDNVLPGTILRATEKMFSVSKDEIRPDLVKPHVKERSGGPGSPTAWEDLGAYGTRFTALGLYKDDLEKLTGRPAKEPIRAYASLNDGDDDTARAQKVVEELERTGAADRKALLVAPATGTGWVNPTAAEAFELMFDGDTAVASSQYSYIPSAVQFVSDRGRVNEYGKALISTVVDWWQTLPADHRPKIYVYGESLGTSAGEAGFSGLRDIVSSVDGVLWMGPPNSNTLWSDLVARRDPGTTEVDPEYSGGMSVRFSDNSDDVQRWNRELTSGDVPPEDRWDGTRVLYVQHPSDPVVWWSPDLLFKRPDWLKEPAGFDRSPTMTWMPVVTFWQVTLDLPRAAKVPDGHGHNYGTTVLDALVAIAGEDRFSPDRVEQLRGQLETAMAGQGPEKEIGGND